MHGGNQHDAAGDRRHRGERDEAVQCLTVQHAAIAAFWQPLRQAEHEIEAQALRLTHQVGVVVEAPVGGARQFGRTPPAGLDGQEQSQHQWLTQGAGRRAVGEIGWRGWSDPHRRIEDCHDPGSIIDGNFTARTGCVNYYTPLTRG